MNIEKNIVLFKCPICAEPMNVSTLSSLICPNRHTFDIARQGYVHLLTKHVQTKYTKQLFVARREVITNSPFFDPLINEICSILSTQIGSKDNFTIADMGCGEGSILHRTQKQHSEHDVIRHFKTHFSIVDRSVVQYKKRLKKSVLTSFVKMTPLAWEADEGKIAQFLQVVEKMITVDFEIIVGSK